MDESYPKNLNNTTMKYKVKITKEILKKTANRDRNNHQRCPIEEAVADIFPHAMVGPRTISPMMDNINECIWLPIEAQIFITKFDNLLPDERINMPELEFDINIQEEMINHE